MPGDALTSANFLICQAISSHHSLSLYGRRSPHITHPRPCFDSWLMLLMRVMIMEYNNLLFARRYRLQWGLREVCGSVALYITAVVDSVVSHFATVQE